MSDPSHAANDPVAAAIDAARSASEPPPPALDMGALEAALIARTQADTGALARLRALPTATRRGLVIAAVVAVAVVNALALGRADLAVFPVDRLVLELGLWLVLGAALAALTLPALRRPTTSLAWSLVAVALALPAVAYALLPMAHAAHPASLLGIGDDFARRAIGCFIWGMAWAAPVALVATVVDRGGGPEPARDVQLGIFAGVAAVLALLLHCPITHPEHLLAGHATVGAGAVAAYAGVRWVAERLVRRG